MTRAELCECLRITWLKASVVRIFGSSSAVAAMSCSVITSRMTSSSSSCCPCCASSSCRASSLCDEGVEPKCSVPSGRAMMALLYRGLAPSQLAPRVGSSASRPAPSEICTTCSLAEMRISYRKDLMLACRASGSSSAWQTQKTRSGARCHVRCLRRMIESSSSRPPSCTTHHTSMACVSSVWLSGHAYAPLTRISAMLNARADTRICFIRSAPSRLSRHRSGHAAMAVFGPSPPSPAVCSSESSAVSTCSVITTCVKPWMPCSSLWRRSVRSMRICVPALLMRSPPIAVEMIVTPRAPLSWLTKVSSPGWLTMPSYPALQKSSTCGRQFLVWRTSPSFSSSSSALRARW
mmetsp:Transcript_8572/g.20248  ORF Transcript_8572/g.20248 Transcript_8572/m.20248 type:complete len:350 (+) Transcript_8572:316-1365(+)